ncbi:MAG TPA: Gfo/Idh/MocA family oxidoreductase [Bacillota bacterium]|nr:Gfo/Idh/MocA family oxidoreductase [Bacillota bacterium]
MGEIIKIAMLGRSEGNGHPYSWSAIINGEYDEQLMQKVPFPVICQYLSAQPKENLGTPGAKVTHVWAEDQAEARRIAETSYIEHVVAKPEDVLGKVDAVIIGEDVGSRHLMLAEPFIRAGLPVFIDKPLTDNQEDLAVFRKYFEAGKPILSSSCYRYSQELREARAEIEPYFVCCLMNKSWEKYGIHAVEGLYQLLGTGAKQVANLGTKENNVVHIKYADGKQAVLNVLHSAKNVNFQLVGKTTQIVVPQDTFNMFKTQLADFIKFVRTRKYPYPPEETIEMCQMIIAGIKSRELGGKPILLSEI